MFSSDAPPQDESSPFAPRSPYGESKLHAHRVTTEYRETHGVFAVSGILFNHESPRRGADFLSRKVALGVAAIVRGTADSLVLGNLDAVRDWGYAPEYVDGMWRALQHDEPGDYVLATGQARTVRQFVAAAFAHAGLDWESYVGFDESHARPVESHVLVGDPTKAREVLGWRAQTHAEELARIMVDADLAR